MKIERSGGTRAVAKNALGALRRINYLLFFVAATVAVLNAVASSRPNQRSIGISNALPANIIVVTNTNDSGPGSLRDALAIANDGDTVDATGVSGTILLTGGDANLTGQGFARAEPGDNESDQDSGRSNRHYHTSEFGHGEPRPFLRHLQADEELFVEPRLRFVAELVIYTTGAGTLLPSPAR